MTTQNEAQGTTTSRWQFDPYHTQVEFTAKHLGMMKVRGNFLEVSATGYIDPDHPEASSVDVTIQTASIGPQPPAGQRPAGIKFSGSRQVPDDDLKSTKIEGPDRIAMI